MSDTFDTGTTNLASLPPQTQAIRAAYADTPIAGIGDAGPIGPFPDMDANRAQLDYDQNIENRVIALEAAVAALQGS